MTNKKSPKIVLITSGARSVAHYFAELPGEPVGIIDWRNQAEEPSSFLPNNKLIKRCYAKIRNRQYASLEHLCDSNNLAYANIYKRDLDNLRATLTRWECDLVITSQCSFVPLAALPVLTHGAINLHPSWLPDYRGAEPHLWHVVDNQECLAASIHRLTDEYDRGAILLQNKTQRPNGASKSKLSHITETVLGRELLENAIDLLINNPMHNGSEQPSESATPYAHRKTPDAFAETHPIESFNAQTVWDLLHYFGYCPKTWLGLSGWRNKIQWRPVQLHDRKMNLGSTPWTSSSTGASVFLHSENNTIELKPKFKSLHRLLRNS